MKIVTKYETEDGKIFDTAEGAAAYEKLMQLSTWYEDNKLYGSYEGCKIEWSELISWCQENKSELKQILAAL